MVSLLDHTNNNSKNLVRQTVMSRSQSILMHRRSFHRPTLISLAPGVKTPAAQDGEMMIDKNFKHVGARTSQKL